MKHTFVLATAVSAAVAVGSRTADASCTDPTDTTAVTVKPSFMAGATLKPVGPHPGLARAVAVSAGEIDTYTVSNLDAAGSGPAVVGNLTNTANPVELDSGTYAVFAGTDDGLVYRFNVNLGTGVVTVASGWPVATRRSGCPDDKVTATPALHLRRYATDAFKAAYPNDVVYVATNYTADAVSCPSGHTTDNEVWALDAQTGTVLWRFNQTGAVDVDVSTESPFIDIANDRIYVATLRRASASQSSLWSIDALTGTAAWSANVGPVQTMPVVRGDRVYVATTTTKKVQALNKSDGTVIWSYTLSDGVLTNIFAEFRDPYDDLIGLVDLKGAVRMLRDDGGSGSLAWPAAAPLPVGVTAKSRPAFDAGNGKVYVGASNGKIYQLNIVDGTLEASRSIDPGFAIGDASFVLEDSDADAVFDTVTMMAGSANGNLAKLCAPWSAMGSPVAPKGSPPPELYATGGAPPVDVVCTSDADCGSSPDPCWKWICGGGNVCVSSPLNGPAGSCDDGNDNTFGDRCYSGVCQGRNDCEINLENCTCKDDLGTGILRQLATDKSVGGSGDERVILNAFQSCAQTYPGAPPIPVVIHFFDLSGLGMAKMSTVSMTITVLPSGEGTRPEWSNEAGTKTLKDASISLTTDPGIIELPGRPGTYVAFIKPVVGGKASLPGPGFMVTAIATKTDAGGDTCASSSDTFQVVIDVGDASTPCPFFGDRNHAGTFRLDVFDAKGALKGAPVQVFGVDLVKGTISALKDDTFAHKSVIDYLLGKPKDVPNYGVTDALGGIVFKDMSGNMFNGNNFGEEASPGTFPVVATCPGGTIGDSNSRIKVITQADSRFTLPLSCP